MEQSAPGADSWRVPGPREYDTDSMSHSSVSAIYSVMIGHESIHPNFFHCKIRPISIRFKDLDKFTIPLPLWPQTSWIVSNLSKIWLCIYRIGLNSHNLNLGTLYFLNCIQYWYIVKVKLKVEWFWDSQWPNLTSAFPNNLRLLLLIYIFSLCFNMQIYKI